MLLLWGTPVALTLLGPEMLLVVLASALRLLIVRGTAPPRALQTLLLLTAPAAKTWAAAATAPAGVAIAVAVPHGLCALPLSRLPLNPQLLSNFPSPPWAAERPPELRHRKCQ